MINKNYKIISQILSTGNYKQIFDYNFQKNMYLKDIKSFYINNTDFHNIYSVVKKIFQGFLTKSKILNEIILLCTIDLINSRDPNKKIEYYKKQIKNFIIFDTKKRIEKLLYKICLTSDYLKKKIKEEISNEHFLLVLLNIVKEMKKND